MQNISESFTMRQYMVNQDMEFFHYKNESSMEIDYHNHDFYEIYFFISGMVTYLIEGKTYILRPGDILIINNKELHKPVIEQGKAYERIVIWVSKEFFNKYSSSDCNLSACFESSSKSRYNLLRPKTEIHGNIKNTLQKFQKACYSESFGNGVLKSIYLTELLVYINRAFMDTTEKDIEIDIQHNEKVSSIIKYINENLEGELSLNFLSSKFYMSKYHLLREFKKNAGYTIHQYIHQKRLIVAKDFLRQGHSVSDVCIKCGFGDYSNFIRSFKKAYGISPKKFCKMYE